MKKTPAEKGFNPMQMMLAEINECQERASKINIRPQTAQVYNPYISSDFMD